MSAVYITEQGAVVRQSSQHLVVMKGTQRLAQLHPFHIDQLLLFGNVQLTTQAINLLLKEGVDVAFLTLNGKLHGRLVATESKNMLLRISQYERHSDELFKVELAKAIVKAKIRNGRAVIFQFRRNHPEYDFQEELSRINEVLKKIDLQTNINSLMGSEGMATAIYFKAYGKMFRKGLTFEIRTRRPPKDPVNAVLSLGYTILTNEILALLIAHGFDPYIGILHGIEYGRPSLALDLIEEFRHPIIDRFTLSLFNNNLLTEKDFHPVEGEGIYLTKDALATFFKYYEQRMKENFTLKYSNQPTCFRNIIKNQIQCLNKKIQSNKPYIPFKLRE